ncbi:MAG: hypothetical protein JEZ02_03945 [Desulfatibacillum sp.]|nr:hypothetical protein [Desulfatibacillum sp.]
MMVGKFQMGTILALALLLMLPASSGAFNRDLSITMIEDAISFCPENLREYLKAREMLVAKGMKHGDYAPGPIDPMSSKRVYDLLVQRLKQGKLDDPNVIISFGTLAFFLSETVSPGPCRTLDALLPELVLYDGTDFITSPEDSILSTLELSKPYHGACDEESIGNAYNIAVNVIVDFWISAYNAANLDSGELVVVGTQVDHTRRAIYTPEELEGMKRAKEAREIAQAALDLEMAQMIKQGIITKEVLEWKKKQQDKKDIDRYILRYNNKLKALEEEVDEIHRQGTMQPNQVERMRDLNAEIFEVKSRIADLEEDPELAIEREKTNSW